MIIQYIQEHPEKKMLLSNSKWSDSPNFSAFSPILLKLFNDSLISNEKGWQWYGLLHAPMW